MKVLGLSRDWSQREKKKKNEGSRIITRLVTKRKEKEERMEKLSISYITIFLNEVIKA
jgi:hypothetical protein